MTQYQSSGGSSWAEGAGSQRYGGAAADVKQTARQVAQDVRDTASETMQQVRERTGSMLEEQRVMASDKIQGVASAIREASSCLRDQDPMVGRVMNAAADRVNTFSSYVRDHDLRDIIREGENFARRHPALFLGGMFVAGALAARFFKASHERRLQDSERFDSGGRRSQYGYGEYGAGGSGASTAGEYGSTTGAAGEHLRGGLEGRFDRPTSGGSASWEDS